MENCTGVLCVPVCLVMLLVHIYGPALQFPAEQKQYTVFILLELFFLTLLTTKKIKKLKKLAYKELLHKQ